MVVLAAVDLLEEIRTEAAAAAVDTLVVDPEDQMHLVDKVVVVVPLWKLLLQTYLVQMVFIMDHRLIMVQL